METLKKPEMIFALIDALGLVASSLYFYTEIEKLKKNHLQTMDISTRMVTELNSRAKEGVIKDLSSNIQRHDKQLRAKTIELNETLDRLDDLEETIQNLNDNLTTLFKTLKDTEVIKTDFQAVTKPAPRAPQRKVSTPRRGRKYEDEEDDAPPSRRGSGGGRKRVTYEDEEEDDEEDIPVRRRR